MEHQNPRHAKNVLVTGGAGFIGCNFVRHLLNKTSWGVAVADKLTYAGSLHNLEEVQQDPRYRFFKADIADRQAMRTVVQKVQPFWIVNFAAETHVDRSIDTPEDFVRTNLVGAFTLLEVTLDLYRTLSPEAARGFRFLHVSTDEVYGALAEQGRETFTEETPYAPNSPYAASKAGADHLVRAYFRTYGLPAITTNCSNNFGPFQFPEKLIPLMILNALEAKPLPIYGDGGHIRDWLYVEDHCEGIRLVLEKGALGEKYNIGGGQEMRNLEMVERLCATLEKFRPAGENPQMQARGLKDYRELKTFVKDRPGHDRRYAIDGSKIRRELGWAPGHVFDQALESTVRWYLEHGDWCRKIQNDNYGRERLGLKRH
ncbi:MAG: dTDP-glucose 4,6-dehydratase [Candidatus Omnitrophota bacterium]